jgi:hypothetical protein
MPFSVKNSPSIFYYYYSLLNVQYESLLGPRGLLLIYMWGENSNKENPVIHLPTFGTRLLGACLTPTGCLWYSTSLLFGHFGNYCCRNNPTDVLVSRTLLYHYRVIRGCLLLAPLSSSAISFATS